jgi:O-acetylserine/cysteine efflux transporter
VSDTQRPFGATDLAVVAVMNLMWGLNIVAVKNSVDLIEPLTAASLRQMLVLFCCFPLLRIIPGKMRPLLALGTLSGAVFYIFVNLSYAVATNMSALAIAGQLSGPFSLLLAVIFLGERIAKYRIAGMTLAFLGVFILAFDPDAVNEIPGLALTAVASFFWGVCSLFQRQLIGVPVLTIYAWIGLIGSLILFPLAFLFERESLMSLNAVPVEAFGWIAFSAIGSTILGQGAMSWLLQRHPIATVVPLTLPTPVISVIAASLYFKTPFTPVMILGGTLVMIGVAIVTIRTAKAGQAL